MIHLLKIPFDHATKYDLRLYSYLNYIGESHCCSSDDMKIDTRINDGSGGKKHLERTSVSYHRQKWKMCLKNCILATL